MSKEKELKKEIESKFKARVTISKEKRLRIATGKESLLRLLRFLKDGRFWHLSAISCVDWIKDKEFELIYHLSSQDSLHVMLKIRIPRDNPKITSVISIFKNAQTYEREIWEMFGINFQGNPRLIPLLLDKWKGKPPFRKDFNSREYVKKTFEPIPNVESKQK